MSAQETVNFLSVNEPHVDIVKLGFGTAAVTPNLQEKFLSIKIIRYLCTRRHTASNGFMRNNAFDDYLAMLDEYQVDYAEVSDGTLEIPHDEKCRIISRLAKTRTVLSEVGSKDAEKIIPPYKWIQLMKAELDAGANMVIAEAREGGNVGIYRGTGEVREGLVEEILTQIPAEKICGKLQTKLSRFFHQAFGK